MLTPIKSLPKEEKIPVFLKEADLPCYAMFGFKPSRWVAENPTLVAKGYHLRDVMSTQQLIVLSNLEKLDNAMTHRGTTDLKKRLKLLHKTALAQLKTLENSALFKHSITEKSDKPEKKESSFDKYLEGLLNVPPVNK